MQISISNIAWDRTEDQAIANLMKQYHIKGLEVAPGKLTDDLWSLSDAVITSYKNFWAKNDVQIVAMQSLLYGQPELVLFKDDATRERTKSYLTEVIRLSSKLGAKPMVFGSPKNRHIHNLTPSKAFDQACLFFSDLAQIAEDNQTILCIEPNPVQYDCNFINTTEEALALVKAINHKGFRLHLDSAIMAINGEDFETMFDLAQEWMAHFHISEPQLGLVNETSTVPHQLIANHLKKIGFTGWVSIEMRSQGLDNVQNIEQTFDFVAGVYQ